MGEYLSFNDLVLFLFDHEIRETESAKECSENDRRRLVPIRYRKEDVELRVRQEQLNQMEAERRCQERELQRKAEEVKKQRDEMRRTELEILKKRKERLVQLKAFKKAEEKRIEEAYLRRQEQLKREHDKAVEELKNKEKIVDMMEKDFLRITHCLGASDPSALEYIGAIQSDAASTEGGALEINEYTEESSTSTWSSSEALKQISQEIPKDSQEESLGEKPQDSSDEIPQELSAEKSEKALSESHETPREDEHYDFVSQHGQEEHTAQLDNEDLPIQPSHGGHSTPLNEKAYSTELIEEESSIRLEDQLNQPEHTPYEPAHGEDSAPSHVSKGECPESDGNIQYDSDKKLYVRERDISRKVFGRRNTSETRAGGGASNDDHESVASGPSSIPSSVEPKFYTAPPNFPELLCSPLASERAHDILGVSPSSKASDSHHSEQSYASQPRALEVYNVSENRQTSPERTVTSTGSAHDSMLHHTTPELQEEHNLFTDSSDLHSKTPQSEHYLSNDTSEHHSKTPQHLEEPAPSTTSGPQSKTSQPQEESVLLLDIQEMREDGSEAPELRTSKSNKTASDVDLQMLSGSSIKSESRQSTDNNEDPASPVRGTTTPPNIFVTVPDTPDGSDLQNEYGELDFSIRSEQMSQEDIEKFNQSRQEMESLKDENLSENLSPCKDSTYSKKEDDGEDDDGEQTKGSKSNRGSVGNASRLSSWQGNQKSQTPKSKSSPANGEKDSAMSPNISLDESKPQLCEPNDSFGQEELKETSKIEGESINGNTSNISKDHSLVDKILHYEIKKHSESRTSDHENSTTEWGFPFTLGKDLHFNKGLTLVSVPKKLDPLPKSQLIKNNNLNFGNLPVSVHYVEGENIQPALDHEEKEISRYIFIPENKKICDLGLSKFADLTEDAEDSKNQNLGRFKEKYTNKDISGLSFNTEFVMIEKMAQTYNENLRKNSANRTFDSIDYLESSRLLDNFDDKMLLENKKYSGYICADKCVPQNVELCDNFERLELNENLESTRLSEDLESSESLGNKLT